MKLFVNLLLVIYVAMFSSVALSVTRLTTEDFSQLPDVSRLLLSPDGKKLASTIRINVGQTQGVAVQVMDLDTKKSKIVLFTDNTEYFFNWISWKDNKTLMAAVSLHLSATPK